MLTLSCLLRAAVPCHADYTPYDLGYGYAYAINASGVIVGTAGAEWPRRGFTRTGSSIADLGTLGGDWSIAYSVNEAGVAVGASLDSAGIQRAFRHSDGAITSLDGLGSGDSTAYAINQAGTIIGVRRGRAFSLRDGTFADLGTLGGAFSAPLAINDAGVIVGGSDTADGPQHAFIARDGVMTDLGTFSGVSSQARGINNRGEIVGSFRTLTGEERLFLVNGDSVQELEGLGGPWSWPMAINDAGTIVGNSYINNDLFHAFVYRDGQMTDLAPLLAEIGITGFSQALGVNQWGDIVGWGDDAEGKPRAFLLGIPEPASRSLVSIGALILCLHRGRRFHGATSAAIRRQR